jgi:hypothetical protein
MESFEFKRMVWQVALSAAVAAFDVFIVKLVKMRMIYYKLKKQRCKLTRRDMKSMPLWGFAAGNLKVLPELLDKFPKGSQQSHAFTLLSRDFKHSDNCFYVDLCPFTSPLLVVTSPELAIQACQEQDLPKPDILKPFSTPFAGGGGARICFK